MRGCRPPIKPQLPVIPLGINAESFRPVCSRHEARRRLQLPANANVVSGQAVLNCTAKLTMAPPSGPWLMLKHPTRSGPGYF